MDTEPLLVYRIVHLNNLDYILNNGLCSKTHPNSDPDYINIGNSEIINVRAEFPVKITGFGNIGDYVPFYWGRNSIMLYNILTGENGVSKYPPEDIVYLCCDVNKMIGSCNQYFFTDGQANKKISAHYTRLEDKDKIDWALVNGSDFKKSEEDPDKIRRYQAEFLVHGFVPVSCITKIVVYNIERGNFIKALIEERGLNIPVKLANKNSYYFYF